MDHLQSFIADCDRRTEVAKKRLAETQEEISAEVAAKVSTHSAGTSLRIPLIIGVFNYLFLQCFFNVENAFKHFIFFNKLLTLLVVHFTGVKSPPKKG